jgi:tetratricopeptide (TPR) repeat protein
MRMLIRAAFLGAALALAGEAPALEERVYEAQIVDPHWQGPRDEPPLPDFDKLSRELAMAAPPTAPLDPALEAYAQAVLVLTIILAALILISGIDDAFIDAYYWLSGAGRRKKALERLEEKAQSPFAIMVPAWKEHDVIAAMIETTLKRLDYDAFRIFCGVYRNDPATAAEVDRMAARYPDRVTRVNVPHDGPTCKGDCLNHIVRRVFAEEQRSGKRFAGMVLHDSEDVIHPLELKLFNSLVPGTDLVQLPVMSLERPWGEFTAGTYIDDFAESHGKDIAVREALTGIVPGAGVATCYSREGMTALSKSSGREPFNTATLTEDYDLSHRLKALGMSQTFAHVTVGGSLIATYEYFPDTFKAAYRQRARWVLGIAFQGWRHMGWKGTLLQRYFLFRDRKVLLMAPVGPLAYLLVLNYALGLTLGSDELESALRAVLSAPMLQGLLVLNLAFMCNRGLQRAYFAGRYYGALHGVLSLVRTPVNNFINFYAALRAWRQFLGHVLTGKKLTWDKTAHVYPDALVLAGKALAVLAIGCAALFARDVAAQSQPLTPRAYELADEAYKALERGDVDAASQFATRALNLAPGHPPMLLLLADVLARQKKYAEALEQIRALSPQELGANGLAQRGYLWLETGNDAAAEADLAAAMKAGELGTEARANVAAELAYLALKRNDHSTALTWFQAAFGSGRSSAHMYADAGYAAMRRGQNKLAVELLSKAVDEWHSAPAGQKPFDETALFGARRSIDTLERRWGVTLSLGHTSTPGAAPTAIAPAGGDLRVVQAGAELSYTPERGYRDGRLFQLYANTFQGISANDEGYPTGGDSRVAGFGVRYKPLREHDLVLALERRFAIGDRAGDDDWLLRVGFSASRQTDWHPTATSWTTWQLYTEVAYFTKAERLIQPFDARVGRSWKLPRWDGAVVTPFLGIAGEYDSEQEPRMAAGIGPGVALRYWFRESRHRAYSSHVDFSVQYRYRITDAQRGGGLFGLLAISF